MPQVNNFRLVVQAGQTAREAILSMPNNPLLDTPIPEGLVEVYWGTMNNELMRPETFAQMEAEYKKAHGLDVEPEPAPPAPETPPSDPA